MPALDAVFALVKERTGFPVVVMSSPEQTTHVSMRAATKEFPVHTVLLNPKYQDSANYLIAIQCAGILFKWADPRGIQNFVENREKADFLRTKIAQKTERKGVPPQNAARFADATVSGLLQQVASMPLEILSLRWFHGAFPELRGEQENYVSGYLREISAVMNPQIREFCPPDIFEKSLAMNAAFTVAWSGLTGSEVALIPYEAIGSLNLGRELNEVLADIEPFGPESYVRAVDAWATRLDMADWYTWQLRTL
ncbi:MAG: hypothetical protein WCO60_17685 [Verrucomicrobiota bacterium]